MDHISKKICIYLYTYINWLLFATVAIFVHGALANARQQFVHLLPTRGCPLGAETQIDLGGNGTVTFGCPTAMQLASYL